MHIPVRSHLTRFVMLAGLASCAINQSGLGDQGGGGAGATGGHGASGAGGTLATAGTSGTAGTTGSAGTTAPTGSAGTTGTAGTAGTANGGGAGTSSAGVAGAAGNDGVVGTGGDGGTGAPEGTGGSAAPGAAGTTGTAGTGVAGSGVAGTGGSGAAGSGMGGSAGRGGTTGRGGTGGCSATTCINGCCQNNQCVTQGNNQACGTGGVQCGVCAPCHRCGAGNACEPSPNATWNVIRQSATIEPMKPNGAMWDSASGFIGANPDPFCQLSTNDGRTRSSSVVMDSLSPFWNANVAPTSGGGLTTTLLLTSGAWTISVIDQDSGSIIGGGNNTDPICSIMPSLTAATLNSGVVTFSNVESCTQLTLDITCGQ